MCRILFLMWALLSALPMRALCPDRPLIGTSIPMGVVPAVDLTEASGLTASIRNPGVLWTHNDGGKEEIYAIGFDGAHFATYQVTRSVQDFEDIATGPGPLAGTTYLYAGDIGSNDASRDKVRILRMAEPPVSTNHTPGSVVIDMPSAQLFTLVYPDGTYDAETLMIDPVARQLIIVTKQDDVARFYSHSLDTLTTGTDLMLQFMGEAQFHQASGGDISADGQFLFLRQEAFALGWSRQGQGNFASVISNPGFFVPVVGPPTEPNGEALAFTRDGSGYFTISEGESPQLYFFPMQLPRAAQFIAPPEHTEEGWLLRFEACGTGTLQIHRSTDLEEWITLESMPSPNGLATFLDLDSSTSIRFYRLLTMP